MCMDVYQCIRSIIVRMYICMCAIGIIISLRVPVAWMCHFVCVCVYIPVCVCVCVCVCVVS